MLLARATFAVALTGVVACGLQVGLAPTTTPTQTTSVADFCTTYCAAQVRCDSTVTTSACQSDCVPRETTPLAHLRTDWAASFLTCIQGAACSAWIYGTATTTCASTADAAMTPSPTAQSYCTQAAAKDSACGAAGTVASCEEVVKSTNDASLQAATACLSRDCTTYLSCVMAATGTNP